MGIEEDGMSKFASKTETEVVEKRLEKLEEELARQNIAFDAVFKLVEKLGTTLDLDKVVRLFLLTVMGQLRLKKVALFMDSGTEDLSLVHVFGIGRDKTPSSMHSSSRFVRWVKKLEGPSNIDEFFKVAGSLDAGEELALKELMGAGLSYVAPLSERDELVGFVLYSGKITEEAFTRFDESLLKMLCKVATITIKNANLYQDVLSSKMELEKFSQVKKEFINHTSHELRTPLTVLKSALWSIEPEEVEGGVLLDMAKDAVSRLQSRVEYLLSLNDMEMDNDTYNFEICDVSSIVEDCLREIIPELEEKQIKINIDDQVQFKAMRLDSKKIKIVLRSIIDNAVNFVDRGGNIDIELKISDEPNWEAEGIEIGTWQLTPRPSAHDDSKGLDEHSGIEAADRYLDRLNRNAHFHYLSIKIRDNGIGIPPEEIKTLAEPFRRASNSTVKNVKGLGIGLSVSQKIIAGHGGRLFCRSEVGKGAEFSIWLPMDE